MRGGVPRSLPAKTFYGVETLPGDERLPALAQLVRDRLASVSRIPDGENLRFSYGTTPKWMAETLSADKILHLFRSGLPAEEVTSDSFLTEEEETSSPEDSLNSAESTRDSAELESSGEDDTDEEEDLDEEEGTGEEGPDETGDLEELLDLIPVDKLRDESEFSSIPMQELREYGSLFDPPIKGTAKAEIAGEILAKIDSLRGN